MEKKSLSYSCFNNEAVSSETVEESEGQRYGVNSHSKVALSSPP